MTTQWREPTRYLVSIGLAVFFLFLIYISRSVLVVLLLAALIAMLVRPIIKFLIKRARFPKFLAVFLVYLLVAITIILAPLILVPPIVNAVNSLLEIDWILVLETVLDWLDVTLRDLKNINFLVPGMNQAIGSIVDSTLAALENTDLIEFPELDPVNAISSISQAFASGFGIAVTVVGSVISAFTSLAFILLFSVYISLDAENIYRSLIGIVPDAYREEAQTLFFRLTRAWNAFFRGEIVLMLTIFFIVWIGNLILGTPSAFLLGVIAGLLELIPGIGPAIALIPAVLLALIQGSTHFALDNFVFAIIVLLFYLSVQVFENNVIVPRVMGEGLKLHPIIVIVGVLVGTANAGILGALLASPAIATGKEILSYLYRKILKEDPFPPEDETTRPAPPGESPLRERARRLYRSVFSRDQEAELARPPMESGEQSESGKEEPQGPGDFSLD
jgi:predicted PurR-regulated permease PerM